MRRFGVVPHFIREVFGARTLRREPEPSLIMDEEGESHAFHEAGQVESALGSVYVFSTAHLSQTLSGCRRVLDLGCGPATQLIMLARLHPGTEFVGLDLSDSMLAIAKKAVLAEGLQNVSFQKGDISSLSEIPDQSFDGVMSTLALHHLPTRRHLEQCFKNIRRVLVPGGRLCLIDMGRLKSLKTVLYFAYRDAKSLPYLFNLDFERSLRACFRLEDFEQLTKDYFGPSARVFATYKAPLFVLIKTPEQPLSSSCTHELQRLRQQLTNLFRGDLDDLRMLFYLAGLRNDPFGSFQIGEYWTARLRMAQILGLPTVAGIATSRFTRTASFLWIALRVGILSLIDLMVARASPQAHASLQKRMGLILMKSLGRLKGAPMKFGQMMSYLSDQVPDAIVDSLKPLQVISNPLSGETVRNLIEQDLGRKVSEIFSEWRDVPVSAASVSQLHAARLLDGTPVIVKVRYPGIAKTIQADLWTLKLFSSWLARISGLSNFRELLNELETLLLNECEFLKTARFQEEIRKVFRGHQHILVPKVYSECSSNQILTMDYIEGRNYPEFKASATQAEKNRAALIMWEFTSISINRHGLYNADPHPGNYLFVGDKVCFLDFGFVKRFPPQFVTLWKQQSLAGCANDLETFKSVNQKMGYVVHDGFDHALMLQKYREVLYQPWMEDKPFQFTKEFVDREFRTLFELFRKLSGGRMPVEFVAILRLLWGQHAIMADLQAEGNWHRLVLPLLREGSKVDSSSQLVDE